MDFYLRNAQIVLPLKPSPTLNLAASELTDYIEKVTGTRPLVISEGIQELGSFIFLGNCGANAGIFEASSIRNIRPQNDGFVITCRENNVHLVGANDRSVLLGVYHFIAKALGVGFWHYDDEVIPHNPNATIPPLEIALRLQVESLQISQSYNDTYISNLVKLGYNAQKQDFNALVNGQADTSFADERQLKIISGGHCIELFLDQKKYFTTHPDWYPLRNGEREATGHICFANPEASRQFIANGVQMISQAKTNYPALDRLSIWSADSGLFCECDFCQSHEFTEMYVKAINDLGHALQNAGIDVAVEYILYNCDNGYYRKRDLSALALPKTRPAKEYADTLYAYWGRCYKTPFEESEYPEDRKALELLRELAQYKISSGRHFRTFIYYPDHWMLSSVFPVLWDTMVDDFKLFQNLGCNGYWPCDAPCSLPIDCMLWTKGWASFAMASLAWSTTDNAKQLADEYLSGYYGPHAKEAGDIIDFFRFEAPRMTRHNLAHPFPGKAGLQAWICISKISYFYYDPASSDKEFWREHDTIISDIKYLLNKIEHTHTPSPPDSSPFSGRLKRLTRYLEWCRQRLSAVLGQLKAQKAINAKNYALAKQILKASAQDDADTGSLCRKEYVNWWKMLPEKNPGLEKALRANGILPPNAEDSAKESTPYN